MKLVFKNLKIENFLSIGYADINLQDRGFTLIKGINNNPADLAKSNGSGKSSIIEAIIFAITGETIRGIKDVVNMFQPGGTLVELTFKVDNDEYLIKRSKDHEKYKTDLKIFVNDKDVSGKGIRDSSKILSDLLPDLTASLLGSVVVLGQGLPQRFSNNTPSGRKEVLEKLSKSDFMIEDLKKRIQERKVLLGKQLREIEDSILAAKTKSQTLEAQIADCEKRLSELDDPQVYDQLIDRAREKLTYYETKLVELKDTLGSSRDTLNDLLSKKAKLISHFNESQNDVEIVYLKNMQQFTAHESTLTLQKETLEREVAKARAIKDVCPTCGQKIAGVFKPDTIKQELEISSLQTKLNLLHEDKKDLQTQYEAKIAEIKLEETQATKSLYEEIAVVQAKVQSLEKSVSAQQSEKEMEQRSLSRVEQLKATYEATKKTLVDTIDMSSKEVEKLKVDLVYYNKEKDDLEARNAIITKFNTLITRDFRGHLLKNVIKFIDLKAKEYCKDIFETENIDFILDGNNIDILYCGKQYEACSGGEKQKIDLIIQFALRDMLCQFLDFRSSILVLDEIFDNLDSVGCEKIIDLISKKLTDVGSIFIITHYADLQIPEDSSITVIKAGNGVSMVYDK